MGDSTEDRLDARHIHPNARVRSPTAMFSVAIFFEH